MAPGTTRRTRRTDGPHRLDGLGELSPQAGAPGAEAGEGAAAGKRRGGLGAAEPGPVLAEGAALGRVAGRAGPAGVLRGQRGRSIYPGPLAPALCCRKSRLLLARPPRPSPRGFVYGLGLFSEAPAAPAPLAVAQPRAGGNLKPRCQAGAPAAAPLQAPPAPAPRPQGAAAAAAGRAGPGSREAAPRPPAAAGLARCRKRPARRLGLSWAGVGRRDYPLPPSPELSHRVPQSQQPWGTGWGGGGGGRQHGAAGHRAGGGGRQPPGLNPALGRKGHPLPATPVRRGGDVAPTPPSPQTVVNGSAASPGPRVAKEEGQGGQAASEARGVGVESRDSPPSYSRHPERAAPTSGSPARALRRREHVRGAGG
uniref:Uncharacterized protein n=1 Tax=Mustela putorius furo TaxID=9669 RepID=M3Z4C8_MUSPF